MVRGALWGEDHTELGERAFATLGRDLALGITRGERKKRYAYTDPNEDAVAAVVGEHGTLLLCADGHNGFSSVRAAASTALELIGDDPPVSLPDEQMVRVWQVVNEAAYTAAHASRQPQSRTTLILALVAPGHIQWAALGDSLLAVWDPASEPVQEKGQTPFLHGVRGGGRVTMLGRRRMHFVGWPMAAEVIRDRLPRGEAELPVGAWVVLATDGFVDFVSDPAAIIEHMIGSGDEDARTVAERLVAAACDGGAGDNVAVAVMRA